MSKKHKIKESKQIIYSLAQTATDKIYENKFLIQEIDSLKNSIKLIKEFLIQYSSLNAKNLSEKNLIFDGINNIHFSLKQSNQKLLKEKNKFNQKLNIYIDDIFSEKESLRQQLKTSKIDNFILFSKLKEKDDEISNTTKLIESFIIAKLFPVEKLDKKVGYNSGYYYLYNSNEQLATSLMKELLYFNLYNTHCRKQNAKMKRLQAKIKYYNEIIPFIKKYIKKGKIFEEDIKKNSNIINENNKIKINNSQKNRKISNKIDLLTVSQLFDVNNDEGKSEAIIDDELHSDDEIIFEQKVKQNNKISNGIRLIEIKKKIPKVDLSLIEFNKQKVMNEADLYSLKRRKFLSKDIDEQIKEMTLRKKEILHKCKINIKKIIAMKNFSKNMQNNYNILKPLKLKTSVFIGANDNNMKIEDKEGLKGIEEISECESEEENYENIMKEKINFTQRDIMKKIKKKQSVKNVKRNVINDFGNNTLDKTFKKEKKEEKKKTKIKRAKSK